MKYLGFVIATLNERHTVFTPDGSRVGTFSSAAAARRWVRTLKLQANSKDRQASGVEPS